MNLNVLSKGPVEFFSWEEVANNKSKKAVKFEVKDWGAFMEHAVMMNELRIWAVATFPVVFKHGLSVSSWYRDSEYNALPSVGGDKNSIHLDARAADIDNIPESLYHDLTVAWQVICQLHGKVGGANYYEWGMHFDSYEDKFGHKTFQIRDYRKER